MADPREKLQRAFHASSLAHNDTREMPVDRIGALAAAQMGPLSREAGLGALLWRARGETPVAIKAAHAALARTLRRSRRGRGVGVPRDIWDRLAAQVLLEWISDRCRACKGTGILAFNSKGQRVHPAPRNARFSPCPECKSTGMRRWNDAERARSLGLSMEVYRKHWQRPFYETLVWVATLDGKLGRAVVSQLREGFVFEVASGS